METLSDYEPYDATKHDALVSDHAHALGFGWLEGEEVPAANDILNEVEVLYRVALPDRGEDEDLLRLQKLARKMFRKGRSDVG